MNPGEWVTVAAFGTLTGREDIARQYADVRVASDAATAVALSAFGFLPPQLIPVTAPAAAIERELGGRVIDASEDVGRWIRKNAFP